MLGGRIAIVTGGLSGIGGAIAQRFLAAGATVIAADINSNATALTDGPLHELRVDVSEEAAVRAMADAVLARFGRIDCLVNSAGIGREIPFLDTPVDVFDRVMAVNLRGTFLVGQACAAAMVRQGGGAIVNIGSVSGLRGGYGRAAYGASKSGVIVLSQVMSTELSGKGVRVNVIAPGPVETPMVVAVHDEITRRSWTNAIPMGRYATPEEIAGTALFLCSDDASYITGQVLAVDGGFAGAGMMRR
jgi:NAD(P)-dependent dehydrogenase (short-subunit alcohol dehydrogenase family)